MIMAGVCKLCGAPYQDGAKFCVECGAVLITRVGEAEATVKVEDQKENVVEDASTASTEVENVENTNPTQPTENGNNVSTNNVSNTYGAANEDIPTAYTNPYSNQNNANSNYGNPYSNPYGGGNYNAPNGNNPYGGGNYNAPNGGAPYGYNPGAPNGYNQYGVPYNPNAVPQPPKKEMNIGLLVFSIINLILGCCSCTGFIFGGAGLAFVMMAKNAKTDGDTKNYNQI
jgi:hypothetical protein